MYLKNQTFFVLGLSRSGKAAAEFLLSQGALVYIYHFFGNGASVPGTIVCTYV